MSQVVLQQSDNQRLPNFWGKYAQFQKQYLTADFSPRKYFRWQSADLSLVLMDCPDLNSLKAFVNVDEYLRAQGLSAPEIIEFDQEQGFLLLEDFGDATFTRVLRDTPEAEPKIYQAAVDVLTHLHERSDSPLPFIKSYTVEFCLNKVQQFLDHYYPAVIGHEVDGEAAADFLKAWQRAIELALQTKSSIFLRDYHVDNLMDLPLRIAPKNIGLLDFQDAVWAPIAGDLVSLLGDARREVPLELTKLMWQRFLRAHPKGDHQEIYVAGCILSAVRQARIMGLFVRAASARGDQRFLGRIPHLWQQLEQCCAIAELNDVRQWLERHLPSGRRVIPVIAIGA